jgi:hypothetical protein
MRLHDDGVRGWMLDAGYWIVGYSIVDDRYKMLDIQLRRLTIIMSSCPKDSFGEAVEADIGRC